MIPRDYRVPFVVTNAISLALVAVSFRWPNGIRWFMALFFIGSAFVNAIMALRCPNLYIEATRDVALLQVYRGFIAGFFSRHTAPIVILIALGQFLCGLFLALGGPWLWWGTASVIIFLLAMKPSTRQATQSGDPHHPRAELLLERVPPQ
jgi:hypothetical protein